MRIMAAIFFGMLVAGAARGEDMPDQRPALRIEAAMHTAQIKRIGVDAACSLMVTGSDDKTARLWALPENGRGSPTLLRTLRVPIDEGDEGKVYAVALSPDGKWAAAGGWSKNDDVYIFEAGTGRLLMRLSRLGAVINHLAFSPDGSRLVSVLSGGQGMRLWETGSWRLLAEDNTYGGRGAYGAAFDGANRLYTVADDGQIRRYDTNGNLEKTAAVKGGKQPFSIALHPNGVKLAIGFNDTATVEVYDARTLERLHSADTIGIAGGELKVAWSADGARLFAGGKTFKTPEPIMIWQGEGRGKRTQAPLSKDTLMQLLPCGNGIAAGAQIPPSA